MLNTYALGHACLIVVGILFFFASTFITRQRRLPSTNIAWLISLSLFPWVAFPLFLVVGMRKRDAHATWYVDMSEQPLSEDPHAWRVNALRGMDVPPVSNNPLFSLHENGAQAWAELLAIIESAEQQLDICTYVLGNDAYAEQVIERLLARARAGVRVRLQVDALGSAQTRRAQLQRLRAGGVAVQRFSPLFPALFNGKINLRNHRKLTIADSKRMWAGGRNIAQEYFFDHASNPAWVDLSFTLEGPLVSQAQALFDSLWRLPKAKNEKIKLRWPNLPMIPRLQTEPNTVPAPVLGHMAQLVPSGPDLRNDTLQGLLVTAAFRAKQRILMVTPYFVPDDSLLNALQMAALRGVEVTLLIPLHSNHYMPDIAREGPLRNLAASGMHIYAYPSMIHAKAVVVDNSLALCGSANLDCRSLFLNFELMVALHNAEDISAISTWLERKLQQSTRLKPEEAGPLRLLAGGLVRWLGFEI